MRSMLATYGLTLLPFAALDLVWLGLAAKRFYRDALGELLAPRFRPAPALAFYLLFPIGIVLFAVAPAMGSMSNAGLLGAGFGFFAYATYDLTNWATLRAWPARLALVDMAWGTALTSVSAAIGAWLALRLG